MRGRLLLRCLSRDRRCLHAAVLPKSLGKLQCIDIQVIPPAPRDDTHRSTVSTNMRLFAPVPPGSRVLPLPVDAGRSYGALRAELEAGGRVIGNNGLWIAAHARAAKLILVTNNEREFQRVSGLEVQNWAKSEGPTSSMPQ
jgi:hypothetical protein